MPYDPALHHRRSIRLSGYDYSSAGAYFVTICVHCKRSLFGEIVGEDMRLNDAGKMLQEVWEGLPERLGFVQLDEYTVMPNHFHGILLTRRGEPCVRPFSSGAEACYEVNAGPPHGTADSSLGRVIQSFKSLSTHAYIEGVNYHGWPRFNERLWQRNYYERVLRDEKELRQAREYVRNNPLDWALDPEHV